MKIKSLLLVSLATLSLVPSMLADPNQHYCYINGICEHVPDSGSTFLLLGLAVTGLFIAARKRLSK